MYKLLIFLLPIKAYPIEEIIYKHTDKWLSLGPWGVLLALFILSIMGMLFLRFRYVLYNNGNKKIDKLYDDFYQHKLYVAKELGEIKGNIKVLLERK